MGKWKRIKDKRLRSKATTTKKKQLTNKHTPHLDGQFVLHGRRKLRARHHERGVAVNVDDHLVRRCELRTNARWKAEPHSACMKKGEIKTRET
jgi:hypothetical protein